MAMIPEPSLFSWHEIENLADLERLSLLLRHLPDEHLMRQLESLRRELMRNAQLRQLCGFICPGKTSKMKFILLGNRC